MSYVSNISAPYMSPPVYNPGPMMGPGYNVGQMMAPGYNPTNVVTTTTTTPGMNPAYYGPGPIMNAPMRSSFVEQTVIAPPMRQGEYQLLNAGPRYWEESYLLPPARDGEIARVPPSKDTHMHINDDPSLGGETWRVPTPNAPMSDFNNACRVTP